MGGTRPKRARAETVESEKADLRVCLKKEEQLVRTMAGPSLTEMANAINRLLALLPLLDEQTPLSTLLDRATCRATTAQNMVAEYAGAGSNVEYRYRYCSRALFGDVTKCLANMQTVPSSGRWRKWPAFWERPLCRRSSAQGPP